MSEAVALKLYGERNTGTNYLDQLARANLRAQVLRGQEPRWIWRIVPPATLRRLMPGQAERWIEGIRDVYFERSFARELGWKHMNPSIERIGPERLATVRFAMVVKNPYAWLLSLFRNPYHVGGRDTSFEAFLARRLPVMERRENVGPEPLGAVEVWNAKCRGYLALAEAASRATILRYEDFLADEQGTLAAMAESLGIARRGPFVSIPDGAKGSDTRSRADYADHYLNERWREKLSPEAVRTVNAGLDPEMVERFGYRLIAPDMISASPAA